MSQPSPALHHAVQVLPQGLQGDLCLPSTPRGLVIFAHGSGSSRLSPRNIVVARALNEHGFATLLFDLLTRQEESDRNNVFDIDLLSERLIGAIDWIKAQPVTNALPLGLFGASTGAAAALVAASRRPRAVGAVVSRGGRPDLAQPWLARVRAPTLLIVGGADMPVLDWNRAAHRELRCEKELVVVPGATHLFEEPGALEEVARHAARWFARHLRAAKPR